MLKLRADSITWQAVDDEIVCLDLAESRYLSINPAGAKLWPQLIQGAEPGDLVAALMEIFGIDEDRAVQDVAAFTGMLQERNLLEAG